MTPVPTYATWELVLLAFVVLALLACGALLVLPAPRETPIDDILARRDRERLADAAHAFAPDHGDRPRPARERRAG